MPENALTETLLSAIAGHINAHYPLVHNPLEKKLAYGTSGFRTTGTLLPPVAARVVIIAVLRAWQCTAAAVARGCNRASTVGFIVTASHNPSRDNGFKIVDEDGGMLAISWEPWCCRIANAITGEDVAEVANQCAQAEGISVPKDAGNGFGFVQVGRDTRATGEVILHAVRDILNRVLQVPYTDHGIVTTPQLHFLVRKANSPSMQEAKGGVNVDAYNQEILTAFDDLMEIATNGAPGAPRRLLVDASNGVGFIGLQRLLEYAQNHEINNKVNAIARYVNIHMVNTDVDNPHVLNEGCGAEFAHKKQRPSDKMLEWAQEHDNGSGDSAHYYCLDGDADRVIAFTPSSPSQGANWRMLDGDRTSVLYAMLLYHWLGTEAMEKLDVGVVQTAYANGSSTEYARKKLNMKVYIAATGVKNLHPIAHARDIGVYFEANGHGTVLLKENIGEKISSRVTDAEKLRRVLDTLPRLLSQVCGDAIADALMCEVAMRALSLTPTMWADLYEDHPSLQVAVTVPNPRVITNTKDEARALTPPGLQEAIDQAVQRTKESLGGGDLAAARSFVRPSGTEPIVRVYAEASTREATDALAEEVSQLVLKFCS